MQHVEPRPIDGQRVSVTLHKSNVRWIEGMSGAIRSKSGAKLDRGAVLRGLLDAFEYIMFEEMFEAKDEVELSEIIVQKFAPQCAGRVIGKRCKRARRRKSARKG